VRRSLAALLHPEVSLEDARELSFFPSEPATKGPATAGNMDTNGKMTILIVDDNAGVRRLLKRVVTEIGAAVAECSDGAHALAAYVELQPRIVLMDVRMPLMDGLTATRQIRQHDPAARIVIVTDYDEDEVRTLASQAGAFAYVVKQDLTQLAELIRTECRQLG
jgi:CheY-like chemotaxis protein